MTLTFTCSRQDQQWACVVNAPESTATSWQALGRAVIGHDAEALPGALARLRDQGQEPAALTFQTRATWGGWAQVEGPVLTLAEQLCAQPWGEVAEQAHRHGVDLWPGLAYALVLPYDGMSLVLKKLLLDNLADPEPLWISRPLWESERKHPPRRLNETGSLLHQFLCHDAAAWREPVLAAYGPLIQQRQAQPPGTRSIRELVQTRLERLGSLLVVLPILTQDDLIQLRCAPFAHMGADAPAMDVWEREVRTRTMAMGTTSIEALLDRKVPLPPAIRDRLRPLLATLSPEPDLVALTQRMAALDRADALAQRPATLPRMPRRRV